MLDFRSLLELVEVDPAETLIIRHFPIEKPLRRIMPWLVVERPDLWLAYQRIQWAGLEKAMTKARSVASFIGQEPGKATFAGLYRIGEWEILDMPGYRAFPGNSELETLGMSGRPPGSPDCLAFELDPIDHFRNWIGHLTIAWPKPYQSWWRWAARATFKVDTIERESRFVPPIPTWQEIVLTHAELQTLPASWTTALAQWRGIYLIYDTARMSGYVGSACGQDNILGRWRDYARSGHGGNHELRNSRPENLRFSILELTSPDLGPAEVVQHELRWKLRLHTREFGLNRN